MIAISHVPGKVRVTKIRYRENNPPPISADVRIGIWQGRYRKMKECYDPEEVRETGGDKLIHTEVMPDP